MKGFLALILIAAGFVGGYQVGRQPNSPDLFASAQHAYRQLNQMLDEVMSKGPKAAPADSPKPARPVAAVETPAPPSSVTITLNGKTYVIGDPR